MVYDGNHFIDLCGRVGLMELSPATSSGLSHWSINFCAWCFYCSWKCGLRHVVLHHIWDSGYQHCHRSHSSKSIAGESIQFSIVPVVYVQCVEAFFLLSLVEVYLVACCLCSTEYGPGVGGNAWAHFCILCNLISFCSLCVASRGPSKYHVSVSWTKAGWKGFFIISMFALITAC